MFRPLKLKYYNILSSANMSDAIININALELLVAMGFHRNRSERALYAVGGSSIDRALDWLYEHMDDPDIDEPTVECLNKALPAASNK
jgi:uncharacterized UBP type Zn finger protein